MKRRRPDTSTSDELPVELRRFRLEDWRDPADAVVPHAEGVNAGTPVDPVAYGAMMLKHRARRRFFDARQSWADAHGLHLRDLPSIVGRVVDRP